MKESVNRLKNSTSPYLLQHATNPVDWYPWGEEALNRAKEEDKPILVSIGYSSCHWCHVMEHESFENDSIAAIMNERFINIKVDREERPDIDAIYMDAVQAMGLNGGWPLNVFLTPDQKPFYGGTYFPPQNWAKLLTSISDAFSAKRDDIEKSANRLTESLSVSELKKFGLVLDENPFQIEELEKSLAGIVPQLDKNLGGLNKAPKFPMPSNWMYLLQVQEHTKNEEVRDHILFTLEEMANGGIYDHMAGGFARYSTDARWFAPHFEKMLYDNGQLLSLYSEAYKISDREDFKRIVYETIGWIKREMTSKDGGFYSAIDADSEGEEGKFYVWKSEELKEYLQDDYELYADFYGVEEEGNWEHGQNILYMRKNETELSGDYDLSPAQLRTEIDELNATLLNIRNNRPRPGIDTKILTGWNGLVMKGLADAYGAFGDESIRDLALKNGKFIRKEMLDNGRLLRSHKDGVSAIDAYLEDYAYAIQGFIALYEISFDESWLEDARKMSDYVIENFLDEEENLFFFTSDEAESLIARKKEIFDNVIPSSNSQMAINLHLLGIILDDEKYRELSDKMLRQVVQLYKKEPLYLANWGILYSYKADPTAEIIIVGKDFEEFRDQFAETFVPNRILMGTRKSSELPLFENREAIGDRTTIYVCFNKTCRLPVTNVEAALKQLQD